MNSRFKQDLNLQVHLHKTFFSDAQFLDSVHKSFLNQTTLDLRKEKWSVLNRDLTVLAFIYHSDMKIEFAKILRKCNGIKIKFFFYNIFCFLRNSILIF